MWYHSRNKAERSSGARLFGALLVPLVSKSILRLFPACYRKLKNQRDNPTWILKIRLSVYGNTYRLPLDTAIGAHHIQY